MTADNEKPWVVICLGNEPRLYGPWRDSFASFLWIIEEHIIDLRCDNGLTRDEHHVEVLRKVDDVRD